MFIYTNWTCFSLHNYKHISSIFDAFIIYLVYTYKTIHQFKKSECGGVSKLTGSGAITVSLRHPLHLSQNHEQVHLRRYWKLRLHCLLPTSAVAVRCVWPPQWQLTMTEGDGKKQEWESGGTCGAGSANTCCYWSGQVWSINGPGWDRCLSCVLCFVARRKGCAWNSVCNSLSLFSAKIHLQLHVCSRVVV